MLLLPPLDSLRFFEAAARHQSFARAGEELSVTPASVAHRIGMLEKHPRFRSSSAAIAACASTAAAGPT